MTVSEKLQELNMRFQVLYFNDGAILTMLAPNIMQELNDLLTRVVADNKDLAYQSTKHFDSITRIQEEIKELNKNPQNDIWIKNNNLILWKSQVLYICREFYQECWRFKSNILNQVI